ncbi:MarR family transcriptional regulator [Sphingomonas sp. So64.6b]|uniref:MarR family winged helix-turn-helix transcriptional regulator n=1 Tax=Sphingomonas sp. So64.6b TaxID=2997354 RepID=UPI001600ABCF|nr:MarR family transcriptional regulator [Sphingomonas sp. So64.6b]QNA85368.1 MarR family transcriptional regulator [Sphingomonas sp. So64.6b]
MTIRHNPGCPPSALSSLLHITPNNLVPHIDGLVSRGYVGRTSSETDRRIKHLRLTESGETFVRLLARKHDEVRARVEARMGTENVAKLLELLSLYSDG